MLLLLLSSVGFCASFYHYPDTVSCSVNLSPSVSFWGRHQTYDLSQNSDKVKYKLSEEVCGHLEAYKIDIHRTMLFLSDDDEVVSLRISGYDSIGVEYSGSFLVKNKNISGVMRYKAVVCDGSEVCEGRMLLVTKKFNGRHRKTGVKFSSVSDILFRK